MYKRSKLTLGGAPMNKKTSRETHLMNMLNSTGHITTREVVELLDISEATARRMFSELEKSGKIVRKYGGIQLAGHASDYSFELLEKMHTQEKIRIGTHAASLVNDGDTIYLDCGTTIFQMTLALSMRILNNEFSSLNIITNSIANVQAIAPQHGCTVILVGGIYNNERRDFSGALTEKYVMPFHFTKCFLGCDGMNATKGFFSNQFDISSLNAIVIERSAASYILLDSSKFDRCSLISYAQLSDVNAIITEREPDEPLLAALAEADTSILIAEQANS